MDGWMDGWMDVSDASYCIFNEKGNKWGTPKKEKKKLITISDMFQQCQGTDSTANAEHVA